MQHILAKVTMVPLDYVVMGLYLVMVAGVGLYFSRAQKSTEKYFLAGHNVPGWVVGFALLGTMIGSTTFIGHPAGVYDEHMYLLLYHLMLPIMMLLVAKYLVVFYRHTLRMTAYGYLEKRFGYPARMYGGAAFILSRIVDVSATFFFLALAVSGLTGWEIWWVILALGLITLAYTFFGGIEAVVWVSVIQALMLVGGGVLILAVVLIAPEESPVELVKTAWQGGKFSLGDWKFSLKTNNQWIYIMAGMIWAVQRYACDQHMVQKYLLARSDKQAKRGAYVGASACFPIWLLFWIIGALVWAFYQHRGGTPQAVANADEIMPYFITTQFPVGLVGLILSALAAAAMSSLASDLNSLGTVIVEDYYSRLKPKSTDLQQLLVGKFSVAIFGITSIVMSLLWVGIGAFIKTMVELFSIATGGLLGLFALGLLFRRATARGAYVGIIACVLFSIWAALTAVKLPLFGNEPALELGGWMDYPYQALTIGIFSHIIVVVVGLVFSIILGGPKPKAAGMTIWDSNRREIVEKAKQI